MTFELPALPYDYTALEPYIDAQTMHLHHDMHHKAYVAKLNEAMGGEAGDIVAVQRGAKLAPPAIRNNGGGHYNHSLFWKWMAPVGTSSAAPHGKLKADIEERWGSVEQMRQKFNEAALTQFGSGWAWLGRTAEGRLEITSTPNQDNPLMSGIAPVSLVPVLGLDVWEHAYYLKYQNRRAEYIEKWWSVVNWDTVVRGYEEYALQGLPVPIEI